MSGSPAEIVGILKAYAADSGGVVGQIFLRRDGSIELNGDESIVLDRLQQLHRGAAALEATVPAPKSTPPRTPRRSRVRRKTDGG